ncbi:MAG TPA: hypothetical protein VN193_13190 [Candidatus Angelobacter sp.]|jgi:hypothetical protein|nr:hypothetical protein [Candidatus Angelobacter sp.]
MTGASGAGKPSAEVTAALERAATFAADILSGSRSPIDGARRIWWDSFNPTFGDYLEGNDLVDALGAFVGLADDWEQRQDNEADRVAVEARIRSAAAGYLQLWQSQPKPASE